MKHRVVVPLDGLTVEDARAQAAGLGLDPESPHARLLHALQPEPAWEAVVTFDVGADGAVPIGVEVRSTGRERVTRALWDRVKVGEVIREAAAQAAWLAPVLGTPSRARIEPSTSSKGRGAPRRLTDEFLQRVAAVVVTAQEHGEPHVRAVVREFVKDYPGLDSPTDKRARYWVRAARARGFLPPA